MRPGIEAISHMSGLRVRVTGISVNGALDLTTGEGSFNALQQVDSFRFGERESQL